MIVADFTKDEEGYRLLIQGHAENSQEGGDAVCSAVSGIFYALCGYLLNMKSKGLIINKIAPGIGDIYCSHEGEDAMIFACIGLSQIMLTYPGNLEVNNNAFQWNVCDLIDPV